MSQQEAIKSPDECETVDELLRTIESMIEEAAEDTGMSEDEVWHDVAVNALGFVTDQTMLTEARRALGVMT